MLESTWAGAPPSTCNILNHLKSLRASGLCLWWVGIGLRLFRGLSGWVGGTGGAGLHSLGLPIFPAMMSHLWQCLREGGRDSPASLSPVILILCVHNLRHLSKVNSLHLWHTLWHSLGLSLYQQGLLKVHYGPTWFSPLSRFHIDSRSLPTLHICQQCVDFFGSAQTFISEIASIVLQRLLSMLTNQIAAQQPWRNT